VTNARSRRLAKSYPDGRFVFMMAHGLDAAMFGFLASGFFVTVLYYPFFWINLSMSVSLHEVARRQFRVAPAAIPASAGRSLSVTGRAARHAH
jgi:hypothetical protein